MPQLAYGVVSGDPDRGNTRCGWGIEMWTEHQKENLSSSSAWSMRKNSGRGPIAFIGAVEHVLSMEFESRSGGWMTMGTENVWQWQKPFVPVPSIATIHRSHSHSHSLSLSLSLSLS
ncbi:uncharacterized protein EAF01_006243 [Botrytis porri]|uniref:uncharacterized protein n=1 Tax=Botrytis porri TaxID=87229 RepID=UPI0019028880|nr:uncharacterized protein EAF01_006243 [Botrytis porri]KAF7903194.1 hypothetical protein EAF01_006243 [Botrytis porri]